jgi:hypothetical protein
MPRFSFSRLFRWYGAGPLHLLTMLGCLALAGYALADLLPNNPVGIVVWLVAAVIGHDLILLPLYTLADQSALAVLRHRQPPPPAVPWINYLRVPVVLSGLLLLIWFPLIFRLPKRFTYTTTLSLDPYLWHWLAVTGALLLLSAAAYALRLRSARRHARPRGKHEGTPGNHQPKAATDNTAANRAAADEGAADRTAVARTAADRTGPGRTAADESAEDRTAANRNATDESAEDRTAADRNATEGNASGESAAGEASPRGPLPGGNPADEPDS